MVLPVSSNNRYNVNSLPLMNVAYHCQTSWNFIATSHGKSPVDGVGGAVKRAVRDKVRCRCAIVIDPDIRCCISCILRHYQHTYMRSSIRMPSPEGRLHSYPWHQNMSPHRLGWVCAETGNHVDCNFYHHFDAK